MKCLRWMAALTLLVSVRLSAETSPQALFQALRNGEWAKVKTAVEDGAGINVADERGDTLLMETAVFGTATNLEFLLARGANVNAANQAKHTALM